MTASEIELGATISGDELAQLAASEACSQAANIIMADAAELLRADGMAWPAEVLDCDPAFRSKLLNRCRKGEATNRRAFGKIFHKTISPERHQDIDRAEAWEGTIITMVQRLRRRGELPKAEHTPRHERNPRLIRVVQDVYASAGGVPADRIIANPKLCSWFVGRCDAEGLTRGVLAKNYDMYDRFIAEVLLTLWHNRRSRKSASV